MSNYADSLQHAKACRGKRSCLTDLAKQEAPDLPTPSDLRTTDQTDRPEGDPR